MFQLLSSLAAGNAKEPVVETKALSPTPAKPASAQVERGLVKTPKLLARRREKKASKSAQQVLQVLQGSESSKAEPANVKKLENKLASPANARRIVKQLKLKAELPANDSDAHCTRTICLKDDSQVIINLLTSIPSPASLAAAAVQSSGALDALANVSGAFITHDPDLIIPLDRMSVFLYIWGYEVAIPQQSMQSLASAKSASSTVLSFLQVVVASGGAPELIPVVRYLSAYIDMEWKAIVSQNKGSGVCLAATWLLPIAIVPRSWDLSAQQKTVV